MEIQLLPDATVLIMWTLFMAVLIALNGWVFRPTLALMDKRAQATLGLQAQTSELAQETAGLVMTYETKIRLARIDAVRHREEIIQKTREEERQIIQKTRGEIEEKITELQRQIQQEQGEAAIKLKQYAQELAVLMTQRILERKVA